ncbi:MAG: M3 family oligoendopeptidase, partial [Clostridia bacterium]|nr:M3 family oligoendopeptidase [Clostridia bacterium]
MRIVKFTEMPYTRPDMEAAKAEIAALTARLTEAADYPAAKAVFLEYQNAQKHLTTLCTLAEIRHSIDTRDEFYDAEVKYINAVMPEVQEYAQGWTAALMASPYRADFAAEYGDLMFVNA